jgi:molybdopterin synthase sulfur carrier subunit
MIPALLPTLVRAAGEVKLDVESQATQRSVLEALEARYPIVRGTIRDRGTQQRQLFLRFFACEENLSHKLTGSTVARGFGSKLIGQSGWGRASGAPGVEVSR